MRITRYGHSCLLVEQGDARVLLDPGVFSTGFERLEGLTAVLVTHQHPDHLDVERLRPLLAANPDARLHLDEGSAGEHPDLDAVVVRAGDVLDLGVEVTVHGAQHAVIHEDVPRIPNVGYLVGGRFFTPGDALTVPDADVEVLGLPTAAPVAQALGGRRAAARGRAAARLPGARRRPRAAAGLVRPLRARSRRPRRSSRRCHRTARATSAEAEARHQALPRSQRRRLGRRQRVDAAAPHEVTALDEVAPQRGVVDLAARAPGLEALVDGGLGVLLAGREGRRRDVVEHLPPALRLRGQRPQLPAGDERRERPGVVAAAGRLSLAARRRAG